MVTQAQHAIELMRDRGVLRSRDLEASGISRTTLQRLLQTGRIIRAARGVYHLADGYDENLGLAEGCKRVPGGVICLLSALQFHNLSTQLPWEVWVAVNRKAWRPRGGGVSLRLVYMSGESYRQGVEEHATASGTVRVYGVAKTVADCFKYRNKYGLDVALEALREGWRERRFTINEVWRQAQVCRVAEVMRPYLEALP